MPSKRRLDQLKSARAAAVQACKKRKSKTSSVLDVPLEVEDDKLDTTDTSDTEGEAATWFWNESPNESDSDTEEGESKDEEEESDNELGLEVEESRTNKAVSPEPPKKEIKWDKRGEGKFRGGYGNGSRTTLKKQQKSARELEQQASNTYDIRELWQRSRDLGMISSANNQERLGPLPESQPNNGVSSPAPLSKTPRGGKPLQSQPKTLKSQRIKALDDLNKLLKLMTE